jgi:hypothetical protein
MTRLFENDDVILEKDENNEYHLSFLKDGHSKSEEHNDLQRNCFKEA